MRPYRFTRAPRAMRRRSVKLDNVALVPASLLPYKAQWQQLANELPEGSVLLCTAGLPRRQREIAVKVASHLRTKGKIVSTVSTTMGY